MKEILEDIKNRTFRRVYLLYGPEGYIRNQYRDNLVKALVPDNDSMNFTRYEGDGIDRREVISQAETLPFFADRRVILIENSGFFRAGKKTGTGKSGSAKNSAADGEAAGEESAGRVSRGEEAGHSGNDESDDRMSGAGKDELADYIKNLPDYLVMIFSEPDVDKRSRLYKAIQKNGRVAEFGVQTGETLFRWAAVRIKSEGKNIKRSTLEHFMDLAGTDLTNISTELEKLICYTLDRKVITTADVDAVCSPKLEDRIFDMIRAVAAKDRRKALELYHDIAELKVHPLRTLALICRQYNQMLQMKSMNDDGLPYSEIAAKSGVKPFVVRKVLNLARNYSRDELVKILGEAADTEKDIKTGRLGQNIGVELLLINLSE